MAKAIVKVLLEIEVDSVWGDDCTVGQVKKQAMDQATATIAKAFEQDIRRIKLISEIQYVKIIHEEKL